MTSFSSLTLFWMLIMCDSVRPKAPWMLNIIGIKMHKKDPHSHMIWAKMFFCILSLHIKSGLISECIFNLVPFAKRCAKRAISKITVTKKWKNIGRTEFALLLLWVWWQTENTFPENKPPFRLLPYYVLSFQIFIQVCILTNVHIEKWTNPNWRFYTVPILCTAAGELHSEIKPPLHI